MIFILAKVEELFMMENCQQIETLLVLSFKIFIYETDKKAAISLCQLLNGWISKGLKR